MINKFPYEKLESTIIWNIVKSLSLPVVLTEICKVS